MRHLILLVCLVLVFSCAVEKKSTKNTTTLRIAFGSCNDVKNPNLLWDDIIANKPTTWIWLGDNIYGSEKDLTVFTKHYTKLLNDTGYNKIRQVTSIEGIWDDGDYGPNNGGSNFIYKDSTKNMLLQFLGVGADDERRKRGGVYYSKTIHQNDLTVKMIFLDTRYFRDSLIYLKDSIVPNYAGDMLGIAQWNWLEKELKNNTTDVTIIASGIQVLATGHRFEKWSNFPSAQQKLFELLQQYPPKKMFFITGDRHVGEISVLHKVGFKYPLIDVTSSSLTNPWSKPRTENNELRKGQLVYPVNFGMATITKKNQQTNVAVSLEGDVGKQFEQIKF
jgi:alkaline phosphatase D